MHWWPKAALGLNKPCFRVPSIRQCGHEAEE
jgi:hypothetical protein